MIATIICGVLLVLLIAGYIVYRILVKSKHIEFTLLFVLPMVMIFLMWAISVNMGRYHHSKTKEEILQMLNDGEVTQKDVDAAKKWNAEEHNGNNKWCSFSIREEEELIDIEKYQALVVEE